MQTEKKQAISKVQNNGMQQFGADDSENFLQTILDNTQDLVYIYDFEKEKLVFANEQFLNVTGYSLTAIANEKADLFSALVHPDDLKAVQEHHNIIKKQTGTKKNKLTVKFRLQNKNRQYHYLSSRDMVFKKNAVGQIIQYVGIATDISEIMAANEQLARKNQKLQTANAGIDSFSSIASHDLKEPLRKIMMFSQLIIDAEKDKIGETSVKYLDRIVLSVNRLQDLIGDLISYSKVGTEKMKHVKTDLNVLLKTVTSEMKEVIAEKNAIINVSENLPIIQAFKPQMIQLFVNLISNALKYSKKELRPEVKINCEQVAAATLASLNPMAESDYYKITITDNGIGFSNEYKEMIFEAFKKLHGKDDYSGTGIGLAICKKIVSNHNGFITSNSEIGKGSEFFIFLPNAIKNA